MGRATLVTVGTIAAIGLAACGDGGADPAGATAATSTRPTLTAAPAPGDAVLIETRVTDARRHTGEVLSTSVVGESAFCPGGTTSGSSEGPTITTTFDCPEGTLEVQFAPRQPSLVQGAPWEIVSGTGSFADLRGGGSMVAVFDGENPDTGREVFAGTVGG